jgi:ferredoxin hydrogenase small subunit
MKNIIKEGLITGRRNFLKSVSVGISVMIVGYRATANVYAEAKDYISSRIDSVYGHDRIMKYRKSQDNPMVKKLYADFLEHPMSEKSEKLLHSTYVDRSAGLKRIKSI